MYLLIEMMKCPLNRSDNISVNNTSSDEFISVNYYLYSFNNSIRDEEQDQFTTLLPSAPLSLKTTSKSDLQSNDLVHLVLYDVSEKNKKASVQLAYPSHSQWSSPFSISTHGMSGQCSCLFSSSERI